MCALKMNKLFNDNRSKIDDIIEELKISAISYKIVKLAPRCDIAPNASKLGRNHGLAVLLKSCFGRRKLQEDAKGRIINANGGVLSGVTSHQGYFVLFYQKSGQLYLHIHSDERKIYNPIVKLTAKGNVRYGQSGSSIVLESKDLAGLCDSFIVTDNGNTFRIQHVSSGSGIYELKLPSTYLGQQLYLEFVFKGTRLRLMKMLEVTNRVLFIKEFQASLKLLREELSRLSRADMTLSFQSILMRFEIAPEELFVLSKRCFELKLYSLAEDACQSAISLFGNKKQYFWHLAECLTRQNKHWQSQQALKNAVSLNPAGANYHYRLGLVNLIMSDYLSAIDAFTMAIKIKPTKSVWFYRLGYALEKEKKYSLAGKNYSSAIKLDRQLNAKEFGIGVFHQKYKFWNEAKSAYQLSLNEDPANKGLLLRIALMSENLYQFKDAIKYYIAAVDAMRPDADLLLKLGISYEKLEMYSEASNAYYLAATISGEHLSEVSYRNGYVLSKLKRFKDASHAFSTSFNNKGIENELCLPLFSSNYLEEELINSSPESPNNIHSLISIANYYIAIKNYKKAATALKQVVAREGGYREEHLLSAAYCLFKCEEYEESTSFFLETAVIQSPHQNSLDKFNNNDYYRRRKTYVEFYENFELNENQILYESYHGSSISCNPFAIFQSLLKSEAHENALHIWALNDLSTVPKAYENLKNVIFIKRGSELYLKYLSTAKYLFNNVSFPEYYIRKKRQVYVNTWHGTPIKTLGKKMNGELFAHKNITRNFLQASHIISPNCYTTEKLLNDYEVNGLCSAVVAETGYPRNDIILTMSEVGKQSLRTKLGITDGHKLLLYAPTWRESQNIATFNVEKLLSDLESMQASGWHILFKGHHLVEEILANAQISCVAPKGIDTNELLAITDVLVSDYSSISIDFMATQRPIFYYTYDMDEYVKTRGLYLDINELPGKVHAEIDELVSAIFQEQEQSYTDNDYYSQFCQFDDGNSTNRVIDLVFNGNKENVHITSKIEKKNILFYVGPLIPNGIMTSAHNLLKWSKKESNTISLFVSPDTIIGSDDRIDNLNELPSHVEVIAKTGSLISSIEEDHIIESVKRGESLTPGQFKIYRKAFEREFLRNFGYSKIDTLINFEGYHSHWTSCFASAPNETTRSKVIYQHNDKLSEWQIRFPYLKTTFEQYNDFDKIISVSKSTMDLNRKNLSERFNIDAKKFAFINNIHDHERITHLANKNEELSEIGESIYSSAGPKFITIGRLSPEKDHLKLIMAFQAVVNKLSNAKLIIIGDGPLRSLLERKTKELDLAGNVFILGQRKNPFVYLNKADCFVLSSNHEGQPMVLFEALILNKPIVATDIVANRCILEERKGILVDNSISGLIHGMECFLTKNYDEYEFHPEAYQKECIDMFFKVIS